jgi:hypothetical protein
LIIPPKTFLDTQIVINAERGRISGDDWSFAASYLRSATRYCISPLTIGELIFALVNGDPEHFAQHQRRLRVLLGPGSQAEVFDFIPYFFARQFGLSIDRPAHLEDDFLGAIGLILEAPSKDSLLQGFRRKGEYSGQTARIRIDRFAQEHTDSLDKYIEFMEARRRSATGAISPEQWASFFPPFYGISGNGIDISEIAERLSAVYEFEMSVNNLVKSDKFSISKNRSDLIDGQQLFYLCDPEVIFISDDSDFKNRVKNSIQSMRIKTFAELLACATTGSFLM